MLLYAKKIFRFAFSPRMSSHSKSFECEIFGWKVMMSAKVKFISRRKNSDFNIWQVQNFHKWNQYNMKWQILKKVLLHVFWKFFIIGCQNAGNFQSECKKTLNKNVTFLYSFWKYPIAFFQMSIYLHWYLVTFIFQFTLLTYTTFTFPLLAFLSRSCNIFHGVQSTV